MSLYVPPLEQARPCRGDDHRREARPSRLVRLLPPPASPPPGSLEVVAGLLLARAVPFDRPVHASIRARWGLGLPPPEQVKPHRRRDALRRVRDLCDVTPVPGQLLDALAVLADLDRHLPPEQVTPERGARALVVAGLTHGTGGPPLVYGLARVYRLPHTPLRLDGVWGGDPDPGCPERGTSGRQTATCTGSGPTGCQAHGGPPLQKHRGPRARG